MAKNLYILDHSEAPEFERQKHAQQKQAKSLSFPRVINRQDLSSRDEDVTDGARLQLEQSVQSSHLKGSIGSVSSSEQAA